MKNQYEHAHVSPGTFWCTCARELKDLLLKEPERAILLVFLPKLLSSLSHAE